ncbi:hypothetical protein [Ralstonia pseudosolanacearum]|uniref:hypothetical protein n=1 Tax=Ralstonia pseudosolanacearum TaxID=1310165 RepID=UPI003CFAA1A4
MNPVFTLHRPLSGRLAIRHAGEMFALVGVLHLPPAFHVVEGAGYLAMILGDSLEITDEMVDRGLPKEVEGFGIEDALRSSCWPGTSVPGTLVVRFFKAFEGNGWVVFGPSKTPLLPAWAFQRGHAWLDVRAGRLTQIAAPVEVNGSTCSQILSDHVLWPDANGVLHSLPTRESAWRSVYTRNAMLLASLGAGEITDQHYKDVVRNDPQLFHIRSLSIDHEYACYLARLRFLGGISDIGPATAEQHERRQRLASQAIEEVLLAA